MTPFQQRQLTLMRQMEHALAVNSHASTIVPMQPDYHNDPQIALTCISYIASDIATIIQTQIIQPLKAIEPDFFYYPSASMHITVQNVRVIHDPPRFTNDDIQKVQTILSDMVTQSAPFSFEYAGLLSMPTSISLIALVTPEYDRFVKTFRQRLIDVGVPDDKSYFTNEMVFANTSICRYTHTPSQKFIQRLETLKDISIGTVSPKSVALVSMNAVANPQKTITHGTYRFASKIRI